MTTTTRQARLWRGPALFSHGFRPFFLFAAIWASVAMLVWVLLLAGRAPLPIAFAPVDWHVHAYMFGYLGAVIAGFLLTAVPNWTGRLPVLGWPLAGLVGLWGLGCLAVLVGGALRPLFVALVDLALPLALIGFLAREIIAGRNWRNLPVLGLVGLFASANAMFHWDAARGAAQDGYGLRLGLASVLMLIALIGGRIVPSFTRNWLAKRQASRLPVPFCRADAGVMMLTGIALFGFVVSPDGALTGILCVAAGIANFWRMARWQGQQTAAEPLLWVLHVAYALLALGFLTVGAAAFEMIPQSGARHVWLAGAIGLMTLAVMTRASLGHAGLPLTASRSITALYLCLIGASLARLIAGFWPAEIWLLHLSAILWIIAFAGFAVLFWPILTRPKRAPKAISTARGR